MVLFIDAPLHGMVYRQSPGPVLYDENNIISPLTSLNSFFIMVFPEKSASETYTGKGCSSLYIPRGKCGFLSMRYGA